MLFEDNCEEAGRQAGGKGLSCVRQALITNFIFLKAAMYYTDPLFFIFIFLHRAHAAGRLWRAGHLTTDVPHPEDAQCSLELSRVVQEESYYCHL